MLDRALTFANPEMVKLLKEDFIPVAIDQWYQRRQKDNEGDFYRKIASQGPRNDFEHTTQGRYVCTADGRLLGYNNNRGEEKILGLMKEALKEFDPGATSKTKVIKPGKLDKDMNPRPPENGLVLRVNAKVLGGYKEAKDWTKAFQESISRDNAWFLESEKQELINVIKTGGKVPRKLAERIARFHLIDNTRGEPPRWTQEEIKSLSMKFNRAGELTGKVHLETKDGKRGYVCELFGSAKIEKDKLSRFDLVAKGDFWGRGPYTGFAPEGKFPLAVAFRIADGSDISDSIAPHGGKGWMAGYYE